MKIKKTDLLKRINNVFIYNGYICNFSYDEL